MSIPLFTELRSCQFGAVGTTRPHKEFPKELSKIKNWFAIKLFWNILFVIVVQDTLCLAWQDNNIVLALSNIHIIYKIDDFRKKIRKRSAKISINGCIICIIFEDLLTKELWIPYFINNYN